MARTPLFHRLRRLAYKAVWGHKQGITDPEALDTAWAAARLDRREVLKISLAALGTAAIPGLGAGCDDGPAATPDAGAVDGNPTTGARVAIVGAGLAGMHCAYRLHEAGIQATVYEAANRIGGRTFTTAPTFPDGQIAELGGELIDSNHVTLWELAETFGIQLDDRFADEPADFLREVWWADGRQVPESDIIAQLTQVASRFAAVYDMAENGDDATFEMLDNTSMADWLADNVPPAEFPDLHAVLTAAYRGEYGLETGEQSVLNLIYLLDFETVDPFHIFGDSDERYHAHAGSQTFVEKMAEVLDSNRIRLETRLVGLRDLPSGAYRLAFETADGTRFEDEADHVVLALPFTALRKVDIMVSDFSADKRTMIDEIGYGTNSKVMGSFATRIWRNAHNASGSVTSDLPMQQTWDTSIGQAGDHGLLTNFLGGQQGVAAGDRTAEQWLTEVVLPDLETVFPGARDAYQAGTAVMFHWPSTPTHEGSYTCYKPGQWRFWSTEGVRERNIHFCGEHCSPEFQGWMEGAAETGGVVAAEILDDLGIQPSARHQKLLAVQLRLQHPCYHGDRLPRTRRWQARRKLVREMLQTRFPALVEQRARQARMMRK